MCFGIFLILRNMSVSQNDQPQTKNPTKQTPWRNLWRLNKKNVFRILQLSVGCVQKVHKETHADVAEKCGSCVA